ncbi:MAG: LPS export ABC transporter periplasmic protein LptC [Mariprofundaceae bacterium]
MLTWIKWACLSLTVGSVLAALFILWQPASQEPAEVVADAGRAESRIQVDKPLLVEHEGENVIWRLEADKAEQNLDGSMLLIAPRLELFTESGRTLPISGNEAKVDLLSRSIEFVGDVKLRFESDWLLTCETLKYDGGNDEMVIPASFSARGPALVLRGGSLRIDRKSQRMWVKNGVWIEDQAPERWEQQH